ncbi:MAG TPA: Gfo/Idh/MocA family oxidoreductase [Candidatus Limnocylindrales bacterium]
MTRIRTALIGCGKVGQTHADALASLERSELVAVCDRTMAGAEAFASRYGVRPYTDVATMLRESDVQAVSICTPHPLHADAIEIAAANRVHVLVEKPLAATLADCDRAIAACAAAGVRLAVVSQRRFYPPILRMKAAIDAGKIGRPAIASVDVLGWRDAAYYASNPWRGTWAGEGGGVLVNQAPHQIDLMLWLMGPIEELFGYWDNVNHPAVEVDDTALAVIRFRGGGLGTILVSNAQNPGVHGRIHVHGSNGATIGTQTDFGSMFISGVTTSVDPPVNDLWTIEGEAHLLQAWQAEDLATAGDVDVMSRYHELQIADFLDSIVDGRPPAVDGDDGRRVVEVFTAIYRSQRDHRPVEFPLTAETDRADLDGRLIG